MKILLTGLMNAFSKIGLMIKKPGLKIRKRLLKMVSEGGVKDVAVGWKNQMLVVI